MFRKNVLFLCIFAFTGFLCVNSQAQSLIYKSWDQTGGDTFTALEGGNGA